jgi:2-dehydropantoate 2-reductase
MHIAIFGAGGVGSYFGGRLADSGERVTFIARGDHLRAIQANGLRVDSIKGDFLIKTTDATDDPRQVGPVDVILVGVKAWQVAQAAQAMRPLVGADTFVVPLLNGVDAPGQLAQVLGAKHVLGGLCKISAFIAEPGHIRHVGIEPYVAFGELDKQPTRRVERLRKAFDRAGVLVEVPADIKSAMWSKFLFIAAISGVGAVTRSPAGVIRKFPGTRQMLEGAMSEVFAVARAQGINLPQSIVGDSMNFVDSLPVSVTASMQRDIFEGRPSELESQNGAVVRMGKDFGVPTPINDYLYNSLLPQELRARGELDF